MNNLTPIEKVDNFFLKREDTYCICGVYGGKARSCYFIIQEAINKGYFEFCTAGSRMSPQCELVSYICESLNVKCHLFMPFGKNTSVIDNINKNKNSTIHRVKCGYNNVLISNCLKYSKEHSNVYYIPFGMEDSKHLNLISEQVQNIPSEVKHIVVPVGSGMTFCGIIKGLNDFEMYDKIVTGIIVGKNPDKIIKKYIYFNEITYNLIESDIKYDKSINASIGNIQLDGIYEAKCLKYLNKNDLLWIVGKRL